MPRRADGLDGVADRVDAGAVPFDARQVALRRPAAVAVHDDGDVRRQPLEVDLTDQHLVRVARPESTPAVRPLDIYELANLRICELTNRIDGWHRKQFVNS